MDVDEDADDDADFMHTQLINQNFSQSFNGFAETSTQYSQEPVLSNFTGAIPVVLCRSITLAYIKCIVYCFYYYYYEFNLY